MLAWWRLKQPPQSGSEVHHTCLHSRDLSSSSSSSFLFSSSPPSSSSPSPPRTAVHVHLAHDTGDSQDILTSCAVLLRSFFPLLSSSSHIFPLRSSRLITEGRGDASRSSRFSSFSRGAVSLSLSLSLLFWSAASSNASLNPPANLPCTLGRLTYRKTRGGSLPTAFSMNWAGVVPAGGLPYGRRMVRSCQTAPREKRRATKQTQTRGRRGRRSATTSHGEIWNVGLDLNYPHHPRGSQRGQQNARPGEPVLASAWS